METLPELTKGTIYRKQNYNRVEDWIACWSSELDACEKLLRRSFTHAGSVNLVKRSQALSSEIKRLEKEKRLKVH